MKQVNRQVQNGKMELPAMSSHRCKSQMVIYLYNNIKNILGICNLLTGTQ